MYHQKCRHISWSQHCEASHHHPNPSTPQNMEPDRPSRMMQWLLQLSARATAPVSAAVSHPPVGLHLSSWCIPLGAPAPLSAAMSQAPESGPASSVPAQFIGDRDWDPQTALHISEQCVQLRAHLCATCCCVQVFMTLASVLPLATAVVCVVCAHTLPRSILYDDDCSVLVQCTGYGRHCNPPGAE